MKFIIYIFFLEISIKLGLDNDDLLLFIKKYSKWPDYANFESKNFPKLVTNNQTVSEIFPSEVEKNPDQKINLLNYSKKINKNLVDTSTEYQLGAFFIIKII